MPKNVVTSVTRLDGRNRRGKYMQINAVWWSIASLIVPVQAIAQGADVENSADDIVVHGTRLPQPETGR